MLFFIYLLKYATLHKCVYMCVCVIDFSIHCLQVFWSVYGHVFPHLLPPCSSFLPKTRNSKIGLFLLVSSGCGVVDPNNNVDLAPVGESRNLEGRYVVVFGGRWAGVRIYATPPPKPTFSQVFG